MSHLTLNLPGGPPPHPDQEEIARITIRIDRRGAQHRGIPVPLNLVLNTDTLISNGSEPLEISVMAPWSDAPYVSTAFTTYQVTFEETGNTNDDPSEDSASVVSGEENLNAYQPLGTGEAEVVETTAENVVARD